MRHGNPFILGIAGCYCDNLPFLFFGKGGRSPGALCIIQDRLNLPAIERITQATDLVFGLQTFQFGLVILPTLTPAADGIPSNRVFGSD